MLTLLKTVGLNILICIIIIAPQLVESQQSNDNSALNIVLDEPVTVAQAEKENIPWGIWQFPNIYPSGTDQLEITFSKSIDDAALESASKFNVPGLYHSNYEGKIWKQEETEYTNPHSSGNCLTRSGDIIFLQSPPPQDIAKNKLPEPVGLCDHGYNGVYMVRDPIKMPKELGQWYLMRKPAGKDTWEKIPAIIDDPDGGVLCYDPAGKDYSVIYGQICTKLMEMNDGSLLSVFYAFRINQNRKPRPKWESYCLRSTDEGRTWKFYAIIGRDDSSQWAGFTEPTATILLNNWLFAALRTEMSRRGPLFTAYSTDDGKTWSKPEIVYEFGVLPQLLTLKNGVTVLSFGRPGVHILFSCDGKGKKWGNLTTLVSQTTAKDHTSGYTGLVATGPDKFIIVYDQFDYPDGNGLPRKTILIRSCRVSHGSR